MSVGVPEIALAAAKPVAVPANWKLLAVLIGLAVLGVLYLVTWITSGQPNPWKLVQGADGAASTSKFQWFLWIIVILFSYSVLWVLRARGGDWSAISDVPGNLLTVLGFSTGTAAAAKGITSGYIQSGRVGKTTAAQKAAAPAVAGAPAQQPAASQGGILRDDTGTPELAKIQMTGFTLVAVGIFLATVIHQIVANPVVTSLPNIDSSLLVLMGISQGGYLGKKLVTFGAPVVYAPDPVRAPAQTAVTLSGTNLGSSSSGNQLTMDGTPIATTSWTASSIGFSVPGNHPDTGAPWPAGTTTVQLVVSVMGQTSNSVPFGVTA
jgi:IPT/TIG domain